MRVGAAGHEGAELRARPAGAGRGRRLPLRHLRRPAPTRGRLRRRPESLAGCLHGLLPQRRRRPAEAAHPAPRPRRTALPRGADGRGGLLLRLLAALPPRRAVGDRRQPGVGARATRPGRPTTRSSRGTSSCTRCSPRATHAATPSPAGGWCSATTTSGSATSSPAPSASPYYRNAIGDECVYVESGSRRRRDGVRRRGLPDRRLRRSSRGPPRTAGCRSEASRLYAIEANSHIAPPKRYLSRFGQLLEHAPYCERDLHGRRTRRFGASTASDVEVLVKHRTVGAASSAPG